MLGMQFFFRYITKYRGHSIINIVIAHESNSVDMYILHILYYSFLLVKEQGFPLEMDF